MATIAENLDRIVDAKEAIRGAITAKGVQVPSDAKIDEYSTFIGQIEGGGVNVTEVISKFIGNQYDGTIDLSLYPWGLREYGLCYTRFNKVVLHPSYTAIPESFCRSMLNLTEIDLSNITRIYDGAFNGCINLENIIWNDDMTDINANAFRYCHALSSINLPSNLVTLGDNAFADCGNISSIVLPETLKSIGNRAFSHNKIDEVVIPDSVELLGNSVFTKQGDARINKITLGRGIVKYHGEIKDIARNYVFQDNLEEIGNDTFYGTRDEIETITFLGTTPPIFGDASEGDDFRENPNIILYCPAESLEAYKTAYPPYADKFQAIQ